MTDELKSTVQETTTDKYVAMIVYVRNPSEVTETRTRRIRIDGTMKTDDNYAACERIRTLLLSEEKITPSDTVLTAPKWNQLIQPTGWHDEVKDDQDGDVTGVNKCTWITYDVQFESVVTTTTKTKWQHDEV